MKDTVAGNIEAGQKLHAMDITRADTCVPVYMRAC